MTMNDGGELHNKRFIAERNQTLDVSYNSTRRNSIYIGARQPNDESHGIYGGYTIDEATAIRDHLTHLINEAAVPSKRQRVVVELDGDKVTNVTVEDVQ